MWAGRAFQGGEDWYVGWQGIPVNNCPWEKCESVIVFKVGICLHECGCIYLDSLVLGVRYWDAGNATRLYEILYSIKRQLSMRFWSRECQFSYVHGSDAGSVVILHTPTWQPFFGLFPLSVYQRQCGGTILLKGTPTAA